MKYCCEQMDIYVEGGCINLNGLVKKIRTTTKDEIPIDIWIEYCPFCGKELKEGSDATK